MKDTELYGQLLGLTTPWTVSKVELRLKQGAVVAHVEHAPGTKFACPKWRDALGGGPRPRRDRRARRSTRASIPSRSIASSSTRPYTIRLHGNASDLPTSLDFARCTSAGHFPLIETLDFEAARASGIGRFEMDILPDTRALILRTEACVWMVRIGHVDPLPDAPPSVAPASVVQRLVALGLLASRTRANGGEASSVEDALCVFQGTFMGLEEPHGTLDAATLDARFAHVDEESA